MSLNNLFNQSKDIAEGHLNELFDKNRDISVQRMQICLKCPLYKSAFGGQCNPRLWLNPINGDVSNIRLDGYYKGCGCRLQAKTRVSSAHCPVKKW